MTFVTTSLHLLCAQSVCLLPRSTAHEALSWSSLRDHSRAFCSLEAPLRAVASWVFAQPVGGGRLIWFLLIHSLICFSVHSAFPRPGMAWGLCWALQPVIMVFYSSMSDHSPVPGSVLHPASQVFPGLVRKGSVLLWKQTSLKSPWIT